MKKNGPWLLLGALLTLSASADDIRGADKLLCSVQQTSLCFAEVECTNIPPTALNIPQFIEIDIKGKKMSTTAASGENRQTPIDSVARKDGHLLLHGYEQERAFTMLVPELTGLASFASVGEDRSVVAFAACTPLPTR